VLSQQNADFEVLVVDDGSRDATASHLRDFGDPRLRCISHAHPLGVVQARNRGIEEARGRWVAFLDDDDLWSPRKLRGQLDEAAAIGAEFVYSSAVVVDARGRVVLVDAAPDPSGLAERLLIRNIIPAGSSNILATRDLLRRLAGFDEALGPLADWDLWIRMSAQSRGAACEETLVAYVEHSENMHTLDLETRKREFAYLAQKHRDACGLLGVEFGGVALALSAARRQRVQGRRVAAARTYLRAGVEHRRPELLARAASSLFGEPLAQAMRRLRWASSQARPEWLEFYL
jgi:glycosyltransferase involved in cell wall biosynthesis